jgi:predicted deacylase
VAALPPATLPESVCTQAQEYLIAAGDSVERVAERFDVPAGQLATVNRLDLTAPLVEGSRLVIPCASSVASTPTLAVTAETTADSTVPDLVPQMIGYSALGHPLEVYRFGAGPDRIVFIGGIHGGYEWNTVLLAYAVIDYLAAHPASIPPNVTVEIIPAANPDGVVAVAGHLGRFTAAEVATDARPGRFNGNGVDLNRNWDCRWAPVGLWGKTEVSGGAAPHSELETQALIAFLRNPEVKAAIFWHSAVPGVFAGGCEGTFEPGVVLAQVYAAASGYPYQAAFTSYTVTGDSVDWLATQGLPAIEVELHTHDALEWEQNLAGVLAVLTYHNAGEP